MLTVWLKVLHITALVIWCGGLLILPALFSYRQTVTSQPELWHLERIVRFAYTIVISPAAFAAVVTGTALIFVREVFTEWFAAKLAVVGLLAVLHIRIGHVISPLFGEAGRYQTWRMWLSIFAALTLIGAILWLVLAKPRLDLTILPQWLLEPRDRQSLPDIIKPTP